MLTYLLTLLVGAAPTPQIQLDIVIADVATSVPLKGASSPLANERKIPVAGILKDDKEFADYTRYLADLRDKGLVKTLTEPRVVTLSGRPASVLRGGEQAIPIPAGMGQVGVQFVEFGVRLNFLPVSNPGGKVTLEVETEAAKLDPPNGRDTVRYSCRVADLCAGQTVLLGGIRHEEGRQLAILITPHVLPGEPIPPPAGDTEKARRVQQKIEKLQKKLDVLRRPRTSSSAPASSAWPAVARTPAARAN